MLTPAQKWRRKLAVAFILGMSGSIDSSLALMLMAPEKFNLGVNLSVTLQTALILGLLTGAKFFFYRLGQEPLPPENGNGVQSNPRGGGHPA